MKFNVSEKEIKNFVKNRFSLKYNEREFNKYWNVYKHFPAFKINENLFEIIEKSDNEELKSLSKKDIKKIHYILRLVSQYFMTKTFEAMKIDLEDPNVAENLNEGNIGTPGRIIKMWTGADIHDDRELLGGRFHVPVRLAKFPNEISSEDYDNPIIKEVDLTAVCSHHLAPFSTKFSDKSKVIISYIPDKYVLGISKLQRVVRYVAQRGWLQEDLTKAIYDEIRKVAETDSIYVKLKNIKHSCSFLRGALEDSEGFTTEYYGGKFKENKDLLQMVRYY